MRNLFIFFLFSSCSLSAFNMFKIRGESDCSEEANCYDPFRVSLAGDLLIWLPQASGLDLYFGSGSSQQVTLNSVTTTNVYEVDEDPPFSWDLGYRLALGGKFESSPWEMLALWTDFKGSLHKKLNHGKWTVTLQQLDLAFFYEAIFCNLQIEPLIGLRGAAIHQKLYSEVLTNITISGATGTDSKTFRERERFFGMGPLFGLNTQYAIKYGISFYGNLSFSLLYGYYHLKSNDTEIFTQTASTTETVTKLTKYLKAFDFDLDLALGIQWNYPIYDQWDLTMKLGLENHQYFNQSRLGQNIGNLSFSGGIFSLGLTF